LDIRITYSVVSGLAKKGRFYEHNQLALHPASDKNPAGKLELGFTVADVEAFSGT
jgi:hypothetical protein